MADCVLQLGSSAASSLLTLAAEARVGVGGARGWAVDVVWAAGSSGERGVRARASEAVGDVVGGLGVRATVG